MSTPWKDMESAVWAYLAAQPTYSSLALREYRGYTGEVLPVDPKAGLFAAAHLPALASEAAGLTTAGFLENGIHDLLESRWTLIYSTSGGNVTRDLVEAAAASLCDIINGSACKRSRFGAADKIADYTFTPESVSAIRGHGDGTIRFWVWQFTLVLTGNRRFLV